MLLLECLLGLIRFLLGAALFSFMNVVAWRLPRNMDPLKGRSICPRCGRTLDAPDLVPVFSWLFLRGRCRHCGAHIPARYLLVEVLGGVLALGCTRQYGAALALPDGLFGMSWAALLALAVCGILLSIALIRHDADSAYQRHTGGQQRAQVAAEIRQHGGFQRAEGGVAFLGLLRVGHVQAVAAQFGVQRLLAGGVGHAADGLALGIGGSIAETWHRGETSEG